MNGAAVAMVALAVGGPVARAPVTLTLDEALAWARAHPRLTQAHAGEVVAEARVSEALAAYLPSAAVGLSVWRATANASPQPGQGLPADPRPASGSAYSFFAVTAGLTQPIWDFGRTRGHSSAAEASVRAARSEGDTVAADVDLGVRITYYEALAAEELLRIADETVANLRRHLLAATRLVEVGKRPPFDVTRARLDVARASTARLTAAAELAQARLSLAVAIGMGDLPDVILERPPRSPGPDPGFDELVSGRLGRRPELVALDARIAAQQAEMDAQRSSYWPILTATGQLVVRGVERRTWDRDTNWQFGIQLAVPFLAGGADRARVRRESAVLDQLRAARTNLAFQIRIETRKLVDAVATAHASADATTALVVQAGESLAAAEARYAAGVANLLELTDAQRTFTTAQADATRAEYDLAIARARLHRAAGAG